MMMMIVKKNSVMKIQNPDEEPEEENDGPSFFSWIEQLKRWIRVMIFIDLPYRHFFKATTTCHIASVSISSCCSRDEETQIDDSVAPAKSSALVKLGSFYALQDNDQDDLKCYDQADKLTPDNVDVFHHRGQVLLTKGAAEEAVNQLAKAIQMCPDFALAAASHLYILYRQHVHNENYTGRDEVLKVFPSYCADFLTLLMYSISTARYSLRINISMKVTSSLIKHWNWILRMPQFTSTKVYGTPKMSTANAINEVVKELVAGAAGGMAGLAVGYPFDTIKVYQQVLGGTMWNTAVHIVQKKGIVKGLFRGMAIPLYTNGAIFAVFFASCTSTLNFFTRRDGRAEKYPNKHPEDLATYGEIFAAGCVGGAAQTIVAGPVELIKVQMQLSGDDKPSGVTTFKRLMQVRGWRGLGMGMGATLLRDVHSHGVYTTCYNYYLDQICRSGPSEESVPSPYCLFAAGGTAGVIFWWSCIPMDVVKSRLQADDIENPKYKNSVDCIRQIVRKEGVIMPFWGGFLATTIRAFPSNGAIFLVYIATRKLYDYVAELVFK